MEVQILRQFKHLPLQFMLRLWLASNGRVCYETDLSLTGGPAGMSSYTWSGPNAFSNNTDQYPDVSANATTAMGGLYILTVTDGYSCSSTASTNAIVNQVLTASVLSGTTSVCSGASANLAVTITGGLSPYSVTIDNGVGTINNYISGSSIPVTPGSTTTYNIISVTDANGCFSGSISGSPTITVNPNLPVSISIAASVNPICSGSSVTFTATPVNGGSSPFYQWQLNGSNTGTNSNTYSYIPVNNDIVKCILTSDALCATGSPANSNPVTMTVSNSLPVSVSITSSDNPACGGESVTFTATPVNGGIPPDIYGKTMALSL